MVAFNPSHVNEEPWAGHGLTVTVFGHVRAWLGGVELDLGSPQQRLTLAVLVLARGRVVQVPELISALWGDREPPSARGTVRTYVHRLRRVFGDGPDARNPLRSVGNGYQLEIDDRASDVGRFLTARQAANEVRAQDPHRALGLLRDAVAEWTDDATAGLPGTWAEGERNRLKRQIVQTIETLAELELELGHHTEAVERLAALAEDDPLRERVHELLMLALYRASRPAEALTVFEGLRVTLRDELGADPGPSVRTLHERILNADPALLAAAPQEAQSAAGPAVVRPAQLPAALPSFVGRQAELDELTARMTTDPVPGVVVVTGTAGVGKTTFAVHWANQAVSSYPDGQIYVNLRGFEAGGVARQPEEVLAELLDALGVPKSQQPMSVDALTALYRSALAERRVLVLLDNAQTTAQVLPLLPSGAHCLALVTSRVELTGLVATTGAYPLTLELMDDQESTALVAARLGAARVAAEPEAVRRIADLCARLPLALAVVCARIANNPRLPLSEAVEQITLHAENRLDALHAADPSTDLRSLLSWSYRALTPEAARLFRLTSLLPGATFTHDVLTSLAGSPRRKTTALVHELTGACLLIPHRGGRYGWHDLLRDYAGELLEENDSAEDVRAAHRRILDHHLLFARAGMAVIDPNNVDWPPPLEVSPEVLSPGDFDQLSAVRMFDDTYEDMMFLIRRASWTGFPQHTWHLTWFLRRYLDWTGRIDDLAACNRIALDTARKAGDVRGVGYAHRGLSRVAWWRNDIQTCLDHANHARAAFAEVGDRLAEVYTHRQSIGVLASVHRCDEALARIADAQELLRTESRADLECGMLCLTARCLLQQGRHQDAIDTVLEARKINTELGNVTYAMDISNVLIHAHSQLGEHRAAVEAMQQLLEIEHLNDVFSGPNYAVSRRGQRTFEMTRFSRMIHEAGEHARAEAIQREVLDRLRTEATDNWPTMPGSREARERQAFLADLDALTAVGEPDLDWHLTCERAFFRFDQATSALGSHYWLDWLAGSDDERAK